MEKSWLILPIPPKYLATELLIFTLSLNPLIYGLPNYIVIINIYLVPARYCEVIYNCLKIIELVIIILEH